MLDQFQGSACDIWSFAGADCNLPFAAGIPDRTLANQVGNFQAQAEIHESGSILQFLATLRGIHKVQFTRYTDSVGRNSSTSCRA